MTTWTPHAENLVAKGRGRAAHKRSYDPTILEVNDLRIGDRVRVGGEHYEKGLYHHGYVRGFWRWTESDGTHYGAVVRHHTRDLTEVDPYVHAKTPRWEDGGFDVKYLERLEEQT